MLRRRNICGRSGSLATILAVGSLVYGFAYDQCLTALVTLLREPVLFYRVKLVDESFVAHHSGVATTEPCGTIKLLSAVALYLPIAQQWVHLLTW